MAVCHVLCLFLFVSDPYICNISLYLSVPLVGGLGFGIGQVLECFHLIHSIPANQICTESGKVNPTRLVFFPNNNNNNDKRHSKRTGTP